MVGTVKPNGNGGFMLNTDFAVFYDLQLDQNGKLGCKLNNTCGITNTCDNYCPKASTFENALKYANVSSTVLHLRMKVFMPLH